MIKILSILTACLLSILLFAILTIPLPDDISYSTIIKSNKGTIVNASLSRDQKWRMKTNIGEITPLMRRIILEKEDKYFYYHPGINAFAMLRAGLNNVFHLKRTSGASTITMQVARALEHRPRTYINKFVELFRSIQLECRYSKEEILQLYCNLLPYGGNIEGVKAAALIYFRKNPDHLSLAEITALCVIPNRPSSLVPGKHNQRIMQARNRWLNRFADASLFTHREIVDALEEPFTATRTSLPALIPHVARILKRTGEPEVLSSIDMAIQQKTETLTAAYAQSLRLKNIGNLAVVIINNETHRIITYLGSADFHDSLHSGQVDGASAVRQPGSTLKPLLYGICMDEGLITPKSVITDVQINYQGFAPENYNKEFKGYVTTGYALGHSLNIPAVKCLKALGTEKLVGALSACNFRQVRKDRHKLGLSMILGGCGARLSELTGLYSALAGQGKYIAPSLTEEEITSPPFEVLSPSSAYMITEILSSVDRPDFPLNWQSTAHLPRIAWKTGTSYGRRDAWSIGYNRKYTVGIWAGNFSGKGVEELSGAEIATPLLFTIFNTIDYDSDEQWFDQPQELQTRLVCPETGLPPSDHCQGRVSDYFIPMVSSNVTCRHQIEIMVSVDEKISYCKLCSPKTGYKKKWIRNVAPEMQEFFAGQKISYEKIPPHNPACEKVFHEGLPQILLPADGTEVLISRSDPEPLQLKCRTPTDVSRVYWYINNQYYKSCEAGSLQYFIPEEGPVKISCTDDRGRNKDVWINVRYTDL